MVVLDEPVTVSALPALLIDPLTTRLAVEALNCCAAPNERLRLIVWVLEELLVMPPEIVSAFPERVNAPAVLSNRIEPMLVRLSLLLVSRFEPEKIRLLPLDGVAAQSK